MKRYARTYFVITIVNCPLIQYTFKDILTIVTQEPHEMQHRILIGINTQVGKTMLIFRPALKNECRSEENYSWWAKSAITSNGEPIV